MTPEEKEPMVREDAPAGPELKEPAREQTGQEEARCWEHVGVWGASDERCPRLEEVIHCRNCDIFTEKGRSLLETPQTEEYLRSWTEIMASDKEQELQGKMRVLVFRLGDEWLALPTGVFSEVIESVRPHSVPHRTNSIFTGLVNVHGELQLCVSLKGLLGIEGETGGQQKETVYKRMVVIQREREILVFPVDEIYGIHRLSPESLQNTPVALSKANTDYSRAIFEWKGRSVLLLDEAIVFETLGRSIQ